MLEIDGAPAGAIYLDRGQITVARASWVPDLTTRLRGARPAAAGVQALLAGGDQAGHDLGGVLLRLGYLTRDQPGAILRSVVIDAVIALTVPPAGEASVTAIRFEAPQAHWAAAFSRLRVASVRAEARARAERMARCWAALTAPVALCDLERGPAVLTRGQWAIACAIGPGSPARDLAWRCGIAFCDAVECVAGLAEAGLCTLRPAEEPAVPDQTTGQPGPTPHPVLLPAPLLQEALARQAPRPGTPPSGTLPQRRSPESPQAPELPPGEPDYEPPPSEVLTRVLDALRKL